jgi:hypothetical protein
MTVAQLLGHSGTKLGGKMKRYFLITLLLSGFVFASDADEEYLKIAKGTKAIIDAGYDISNMLSVDLLSAADLHTRHCVFISMEIEPNPTCPDRFPMEILSRGFMSCVMLDGVRETSPKAIQSTCRW